VQSNPSQCQKNIQAANKMVRHFPPPTAPPSSPVVAADADGDDASSLGSYVAGYPNGTVTRESEITKANGVKHVVKSTYVDGHRVKKTETVIIPHLPSLADNIGENNDDDDSDIDWSPPSPQSVPSLLDDGFALTERSGSDPTLDIDATIIETSNSTDTGGGDLLMPHLAITPEFAHVDSITVAVGKSPPLSRFSTPPSMRACTTSLKQDETMVKSSPASSPSTPPTRRSSSAELSATVENDAELDSSLERQRETDRKKKLKIKNVLRRLAKSVRIS